MTSDRHDEELFEERWRQWAERPPRTSSAAAAQEVVTAIRAHRARRRPRWSVAAAAAAVVLVAGGIALQWGVRAPVEPTAVETVAEAPALGAGEVLMWLDDETPLYMTFQSPDGDTLNGGTS